MKLSQYGYDFSADMLAKYPAENRDESRLMVLHRSTGEIEHRIFKDIIEYFDEKDLFLFNDTKVFPARLYGNKEKTGADTEKGGSSADEDASGSANGISDIIPPPSGSDELLSSEDPSLFREKNVFLRITLTAAAFCPLYQALFLLLFRLARRVR